MHASSMVPLCYLYKRLKQIPIAQCRRTETDTREEEIEKDRVTDRKMERQTN